MLGLSLGIASLLLISGCSTCKGATICCGGEVLRGRPEATQSLNGFSLHHLPHWLWCLNAPSHDHQTAWASGISVAAQHGLKSPDLACRAMQTAASDPGFQAACRPADPVVA